jgi:hypothetical protein
MSIKYYTSNSATDSDTTLLVETGNSQMSKHLKRKVSHALFDESGDLHQFSNNVLNMWCISKFFTIAFDEDDYEALEETEKWIRSQYGAGHLQESGKMEEDFSMGVEGPTGLNQGIPHGGPGKGCLPKPLYNPKAKAVPAKEKDDKDTEENLKKLRAAKKLLKNEGFALVRENAAPLMDPMDQFENYLHDKCGFDWDEVDDLVDTNKEMIEEKLKLGMSFANISASLDDSCLR